MEEASLKIFQSQVLLPFSLSDGSMHAFLGPFSNPSKKKTHNDLLPEDDPTLPFVYSPTIDLSLFSDTAKMFRAFPPPKDKHIQWLEHVEASKQSIWKEAGIFDFVQLSKYDLNVFDPQMLLSAILFWNRETRAFEFPCDFVYPTVRVYPYQPQIFARQFGLCQIRPTPLFPKDRIDSDVCVEDVDYEGFLKFILTPYPLFFPSCICGVQMLPSMVVWLLHRQYVFLRGFFLETYKFSLFSAGPQDFRYL
uniref:Aminotransferase-like plant mobile domain-containing protein n=1 Tax=Cajanus cajan TaxID=3821 RepID=A0A151QYL6_CAJCA|nr:hypothetical protein KK1_043516 [Cajanus cajan]